MLPSRYGMNPDDLRKADAIEIVVGQGAKPGGGGMLLGQKISERVAEMRTLPEGIDQRSACRHPDWTGPDDLEIKIEELREITDWEKPIYVKIGAARPYYDTALAVKSGADVVVLDGMQGGTAATQEVFIEHVGLPILAAIRPAVQALQDLGMHRKVQLIVSGGIRNGADVAKALALGADAVSIGTAALIALGDNDPASRRGISQARHHAPAPMTTGTRAATRPASPRRTRSCRAARSRCWPGAGSPIISSVLTLEAQTIARACGKSHVHNLEPEDLVALTVEAAAMAQVPLAGTNWIPGKRVTSAASCGSEGSRWRRIWRQTAKERGIKYFLISLCRSVRHHARQARAGRAIGEHGQERRGLRRLRHLARHDAGRSRRVRHPRSRQPDPAAVEAGGRLARRRPVDERQARSSRRRATC